MSRTGILNNPEVRQQLKEIILDFDENYNSHSKIRYKDIYEHTKALSLQKKINFKYPSNTWWKTTGKELVDDFNRIKTKTIRISKKDEIDIPDIMDVINKFGGAHKQKLAEHFRPIEHQIDSLIDKIHEQDDLIFKLQKTIEEMKENNKKEKNINNNLQTALISMFIYSKKSKNMLVNMMETGEHHNELVNMSLTKTFQSPKAFIDHLINSVDTELLTSIATKAKKQNISKVIQYPDSSLNTISEDEYDY